MRRGHGPQPRSPLGPGRRLPSPSTAPWAPTKPALPATCRPCPPRCSRPSAASDWPPPSATCSPSPPLSLTPWPAVGPASTGTWTGPRTQVLGKAPVPASVPLALAEGPLLSGSSSAPTPSSHPVSWFYLAPLHPALWVWGFPPHMTSVAVPLPPAPLPSAIPSPARAPGSWENPHSAGQWVRVRPEGLPCTGSGRWRALAELPPCQALDPVLPSFRGSLVLDSSPVSVLAFLPLPPGPLCVLLPQGWSTLPLVPRACRSVSSYSPCRCFLSDSVWTCEVSRCPLRGLLQPLHLRSCSPSPTVVRLPCSPAGLLRAGQLRLSSVPSTLPGLRGHRGDGMSKSSEEADAPLERPAQRLGACEVGGAGAGGPAAGPLSSPRPPCSLCEALRKCWLRTAVDQPPQSA